jgi:hypothetical protein
MTATPTALSPLDSLLTRIRATDAEARRIMGTVPRAEPHPPRRECRSAIVPRPVPGPLAPERCVQYDNGVGGTVVIVGSDLSGEVMVRVILRREHASAWWLKVIRHWLAWCCGASEIRIVS